METTKEKIVSLELSTPDVEAPDEEIGNTGEANEDTSTEKKPSSKKRRRKRTKSTDKQS